MSSINTSISILPWYDPSGLHGWRDVKHQNISTGICLWFRIWLVVVVKLFGFTLIMTLVVDWALRIYLSIYPFRRPDLFFIPLNILLVLGKPWQGIVHCCTSQGTVPDYNVLAVEWIVDWGIWAGWYYRPLQFDHQTVFLFDVDIVVVVAWRGKSWVFFCRSGLY